MPSSETKAILENAGRVHWRIWLNQTLKGIFYSILMTVVAAGGVIFAFFIMQRNKSYTVVESLVKSPVTGMETIFLFLFVLFFIGGLGALVYSIGKLCRGPPKAGVSPQETIRSFSIQYR